MVDFSSRFGQRAADRLREEMVIWFTTAGTDGTPQPRPVWFWWDGDCSVVIYSKPDTHKLRHLEHNPTIALHFDSDGRGGDIVVLTGRAQVDPETPAADQHSQYCEKYAPGFERLGSTPERFAQSYSVPILVVLRSLRGH
jgi:PPOX class probable F420-dependent enzyme